MCVNYSSFGVFPLGWTYCSGMVGMVGLCGLAGSRLYVYRVCMCVSKTC